MKLIKKLLDEAEFDSILKKKEEERSHAPPVWELPKNDKKVLYGKCPLPLDELEEKTGTDNFEKHAAREFRKESIQPGDFLILLTRQQVPRPVNCS